ncbi:methyl-accepting chemotaxis protein [Ideonella livida]|uniref:Methyl-accepting transducer domain-containing protein n=1 Tax=Ideonella livida TaxID=2707176 RepID=A0A7C9TJW5_9BURK|nr:methyl-accepting chemotaxis protein [Ideonella livida]NDY91462.1 hypothetical protein [Ideonella livida]
MKFSLNASPAKAWLTRLRGYFRYHGLSSPGVRLMRNLSMDAKDGVVALLVALPIAWAGLHWLAQTDARSQALAQAVRLAELQAQATTAAQAWQAMASAPAAPSNTSAAPAAALTATQALLDGLRDWGDLRAEPLVGPLQAVLRDVAGGRGQVEPAAVTVVLEHLVRLKSALAAAAASGEVTGASAQGALAGLWLLMPSPAASAAAAVGPAVVAVPATDVASAAVAMPSAALAASAVEAAGAASAPMAAAEAEAATVAAPSALPAPADRAQAPSTAATAMAATAAVDGSSLRLALAAQALRAQLWASPDMSVDERQRWHQLLDRLDVAAAQGGDRATSGSTLPAVAGELLRTFEQHRQQAMVREQADHQRHVRQVGGMLLLLVALAAYFLYSNHLVMRGGLRVLREQIERLGRGDLRSQGTGFGKDEIGLSLRTLDRGMHSLASLMDAVHQGVAAVSHASRDVANGNAGLANRTGSMRSAMGDVSTRAQDSCQRMDQCATAVELVTEQVRQARVEARRSRQAMAQLQERMQSLQARSQEIAQMVGIMETIAFQSKLLSLNASVEAAGAGENGKGFAVVAQEMRALAERSGQSAQRIRDIVATSVADIGDGGVLAERADACVRHTDEAMREIDDVMISVVQATREGMSQTSEVLTIARDVETAVDKNTRLIDQLAQASQALRDQGDALRRSVRHFALD